MNNSDTKLSNQEIGIRIKEERESQKLSLQDVADRIGVASSTILRYETGNIKKIKIPVMNAIGYALKVNPAWLLGKTDDKRPDQNIRSFISQDNNKTKISIYGKVPAGTPVEAIEDIIGDEIIPQEWLSGGAEFIGLKVAGDSMYPRYLDGDIVIIRLQPDCESGQDAVVYVNGYDATLKTVIKQDDGMVRLQPANPEFQPKVFLPKNIKILGVVKRLRRDFD